MAAMAALLLLWRGRGIEETLSKGVNVDVSSRLAAHVRRPHAAPVKLAHP